MRKMIYLGVATMVLATIGFISCQKKELTNKQEFIESGNSSMFVTEIEHEEEIIHFEYKLNNKIQSNFDYDFTAEDFKNVFEGMVDEDGTKKIIVHSFSNHSDYLKFAEKHPKILKADEFENKIHEFIENNPDILKACEEDGNCIQFYEAQDLIYKEYYSEEIPPKAPTVIYDGFCSGSSWVMSAMAVPIMAPGWNNRVSGITPIGIWTQTHLYERRFFFNRMASFTGFQGFSCIPFTGPLSFINNRTSSVLH